MVAGGAFVAVLFLYIRLRHYVAREKLHAIEDVSQLWKYGVPPKVALTEKGLQLRRYANVSIVTSLIAASIKVAVSNFAGSPRQNVLSAIVVGAFLAGAFFESRLKHHVSRENVRAVEGVSQLWILGGPSKIVLNKKGLRLYGYMKISATVFFIGIGLVLIGVIFGYGMPDLEESGLGTYPRSNHA